VNSFSSSFEIGNSEPVAAGPYDAPLSIRLETSDGALSIQAPVGWAVEASSGFLRIAATEGAVYDTGIPSAARISFTIVTGPARAQDFGLDGHTPREVFGFFALYPESRVGPPSELRGLPWPGMEAHSTGTQQGDQHLIELAIDADTNVVVQAYCPAGDWDRFEPMLRAILDTLDVR
jgi:hypothetical protein